MSDLARRAVRGTLAVAAATLVTRLVSALGAIYLMGPLGPLDFGTVDFAVALLIIGSAAANWGFSHAAIHRRERVEETYATFLVLRVGFVAGFLALFALTAIPLWDVLASKTHLSVLLWLGAALLIDAAGDAPSARLARSLRFGRLAAVDVVTVCVGMGLAIGMALAGYKVEALVAGRVAYSVVRLLGLLLANAERILLGFHREDARWLLQFGFPLWLGGLATTWILKYDDLVVGSFYGSEALGQYARAYGLALLPLGVITGVLTRVSFPLYARLQDDRPRLSEAFRLASGMTLRLAAPMAVAMALALPDLLVIMHWTRWEPMVPLFRWLLIYTIARPMMDDAGGLLTAVGRPGLTSKTLVAEAAVLTLICPLLTLAFGAAGAAVSVGAVVVCGVTVWYAAVLPKFVDIGYARMLLWPLLATAVAAGAGMAVPLSAGRAGGIARIAAVAAAYVATLLLLDGRHTLGDLRSLWGHARGGSDG